MKKLFLIPLMLLATLMLTAACSEVHPTPDGQEQFTPGGNDGEDGNEGNSEEDDNVEGGNGRYLVLYCSRTGNTGRMARTIQATLDCDMIEVVPETPYDEDYNAMLDRAQAELDAIGQGDYPAITTSIESFDEYDIVFIGYPVWYSHIATPMQTFLHNHAGLLSGKRIALFASSGSSGIGTSERDAATLVPDAMFEESLLLTSSTLDNMSTRIPQWLESLGASREEPESNSLIKIGHIDGTGIVRLSKIEVYPQYIDEYIQYVTEVGEISLRTEPGVLTMYAVAEKENPMKITILETYASRKAYEKHIASIHFQKYKQGTLHMVKSLVLSDQTPLNPANRINNFIE